MDLINGSPRMDLINCTDNDIDRSSVEKISISTMDRINESARIDSEMMTTNKALGSSQMEMELSSSQTDVVLSSSSYVDMLTFEPNPSIESAIIPHSNNSRKLGSSLEEVSKVQQFFVKPKLDSRSAKASGKKSSDIEPSEVTVPVTTSTSIDSSVRIEPLEVYVATKSKVFGVIYGTVRIRDIIDRTGDCIGIKRMRALGLKGFPEKIPTHVYIWFQHFIELSKLLEDMINAEILNPGTTKKWIKFVQCHWERDMYEREPIHKDPYSNNCSHCRSYVDKMVDRAIWWFNAGTGKNIKMTFKKFLNDRTFQCCFFSIRTFGMLEVELKVESAAEGQSIRRSFRTQ